MGNTLTMVFDDAMQKRQKWVAMSLARLRFGEFEAFADIVHGVDARMLTTNVAHRRWDIDQVDLRSIRLQVGKLGSGNIVEGQSWQSKVAIYLPLSPSVKYVANARRAERNQFVIIEPRSDFCISTQDPHNWASLFIDIHALNNINTRLPGVPENSQFHERRCYVTSELALITQRFKAGIQEVLFAAANSTSFERTSAGKVAEKELLELARSILCNTTVRGQSLRKRGRPTILRTALIDGCKEYLHNHSMAEFSARELADYAGVSERTLRNAFYDYFGCSPSQYFRLRQLHEIHAALRESNPRETNVSKILSNNGVWEFGRFAKRYQIIFGELPSDTLEGKTRSG